MNKNELSIIKAGGKVVEEPASLKSFLDDFACLGGARVLVHGGGRSATAMATRLGVETRMVDGRRITDSAMLDIVAMVYGGLVNKNIVTGLQARKINALGLTGADLNLILAHKRTGTAIDYGFVGDVDSVQGEVLGDLLQRGIVPVVAPLTHDGAGQLLNTNADTIASSLAKALSKSFAVKLIYCFEKPGVLKNPEDDASVIPVLDEATCEIYQKEGIISEGMVPKLFNGFSALHAGVAKVVITNVNGLSVPGQGTELKI